jgi:hypothetical protein
VQKGLFTLSGTAVLDWHHDGQQYEARLEARALAGSRVQRSTGRITPEGLAPTYFSDKSRGEQATHFDRANGRLVFSNNRPQAPLEAGMQDRLSVMLQLSALVAGDPAKYPPGTQVALPTASTRCSSWRARRTWRFPAGSCARSSCNACRAASTTRKWNCGSRPAWITPRCACV